MGGSACGCSVPRGHRCSPAGSWGHLRVDPVGTERSGAVLSVVGRSLLGTHVPDRGPHPLWLRPHGGPHPGIVPCRGGPGAFTPKVWLCRGSLCQAQETPGTASTPPALPQPRSIPTSLPLGLAPSLLRFQFAPPSLDGMIRDQGSVPHSSPGRGGISTSGPAAGSGQPPGPGAAKG